MRFLAVLILACVAQVVAGQATDDAQRVYNASQESVFLIYLNDSSGHPDALGTGFLAAPHLIITNAHVADAGSPVLAVGPVRLPLKVVQTDEKNDLAVLSVDVDLTSEPLRLAAGSVSPGEEIFAIGNPKGLEKTISQGIVSGLRTRDGVNLIQITTPISHGSSGGPVLNKNGEVIGVAVGMLEGGQNLNFAVPVSFVRDILARKPEGAGANVAGSVQNLRDLLKKQGELEYSNDESSEYQRVHKQLLAVAENIVDSGSALEDAQMEVACLATKAADASDLGVRAARMLYRQSATAEHKALLAYVLYDRSEDEALKAAFAKKGSDEETKASAASQDYLTQATNEALGTLKGAKGQTLLTADFVMGEARSDETHYDEAIALLTPVANSSVQFCGSDLTVRALESLISDSASANRPDDAERWFRRFAGRYEVAAYQWDSEGDRRSQAGDYNTAADAYERAASMSPGSYGYDYCYAANSRYFQSGHGDAVLADGRACVNASVGKVDPTDQHYYDESLPNTYRFMSDVLNTRGVYPQALDYAKESLARRADDPFSLNIEANILENLQRYTECIAAAQAAIRASDGKYPFMQATLGGCYFDTQDWVNAASSYRIAAEGDKTDAASAFNLGLSLARQGYSADARTWFQEALRRSPSDELRGKILQALQ